MKKSSHDNQKQAGRKGEEFQSINQSIKTANEFRVRHIPRADLSNFTLW